MTRLATTVLADSWPYHHDLGTGGWIFMMVGMLIFWGAIIVLVAWAVRGGLAARSDTPEEILRKRLAEGAISVEEYERRRAALSTAPQPNVDRPVGPPTPGHP